LRIAEKIKGSDVMLVADIGAVHPTEKPEACITNKRKRGTFPATFFLACLAAVELDGVALEEI
jgi:hypothetical protein